MTRRPVGLTPRLVLTAAALVAVTALLIAAATTLAMRGYLTQQLDRDVSAALERGPGAVDGPPTPDHDGDVDRGGPHDVRGQGEGTLTALLGGASPAGVVLTPSREGPSTRQSLGADVLATLASVPADGRGHTVHLDGLGSYRIVAESLPGGEVAVAGLPSHSADDTLTRLLLLELLATVLGVGLAALVAWFVVRRQLAPLRDVAQTAHDVSGLELATGDVALAPRVPARLADDHTEVGQVGASLNRLLSHVEAALAARHDSEQQVRQFVADASHELRTPLTTIAGYTTLAADPRMDQEGLARALAKVSTETGRMSALVEDLLLLARLDSGRPLAQERVDVTHLLLEAVADARLLSPDHEWRLVLPDEAVEVTGDEARLHQVVTNLLTNARRHTPAGTRVEVRLRPHRGGAVVEVADNGPGFPPDLLPVAFERFSRGDTARTRDAHPGGAGLGLSLAKAIVEAHRGTITLRSEPGSTVFTLTLP